MRLCRQLNPTGNWEINRNLEIWASLQWTVHEFRNLVPLVIWMSSFANKVCLCFMNLLDLPVIHKQLELSLSCQMLPFPLACWLALKADFLHCRQGMEGEKGKLLAPAEADWPTSTSRMKHVYFMKVTLDEFQVVQLLFERAAIPNRNPQLWSRSTHSSLPLYLVDLQVPWSHSSAYSGFKLQENEPMSLAPSSF